MDFKGSNNLYIDNNHFMKHSGYVSKITTNAVIVSLDGNINCEGCRAKAACGVSESNDKEIEIFETNNQSFKLSEHVDVVLEKNLGLKAVFWAYLFPFVIMFFVLLITSQFLKEWVAGLLSLFVLVPYYATLSIFKNSFKRAFRISILKNNKS